MTNMPNIILIMLDSVRAENVSCYGYGRDTTPNIDAIAAEGVVFEQAISVGCWTLPVHASLFTGLYPSTHGVTVSRDALNDRVPTLAQQLSAHGYQTASFSNNAYISAVTGLTRGFDVVEDLWKTTNPRGIERTTTSKVIKYLEQYEPLTQPLITVLRAMRRMRAKRSNRRTRQDSGASLAHEHIEKWLRHTRTANVPFFLFVNYMECHEPYEPLPPYHQKFMPARFSEQRVAELGNKETILARPEPQRRDDFAILRALYDGELHYLDDKIGALIAMLESLTLLDETMLIITSDHGDSLGEHDQLGHRVSLYDELVHVPLIFRYPPLYQPDSRISEQVELLDLHTTILAAAGIDAGTTNTFRNLTTLPPRPRAFTIAENTAPKSFDSIVERMLRTNRHKYIWRSDQAHELYDLVRDPGETENIIDAAPELASDLENELSAWRQSLEEEAVETGEAVYDEELRERLRALGYVD